MTTQTPAVPAERIFFTATTETWTEYMTLRCPATWRLGSWEDPEWDRCDERFMVLVRFSRDRDNPYDELGVEFLDLDKKAYCAGCHADRADHWDDLLEQAAETRSFEFPWSEQ